MRFLRTFTNVCSIRVNERVYVFSALRTYTYVEKNPLHWKTAFSENIDISKKEQFSPLSSTRRGVAYHKKKRYFSSWANRPEILLLDTHARTTIKGWVSVLARCMRYSQLCLRSQLVEYCMRLRLECGYRVSACIRIKVRISVRIWVRLWHIQTYDYVKILNCKYPI